MLLDIRAARSVHHIPTLPPEVLMRHGAAQLNKLDVAALAQACKQFQHDLFQELHDGGISVAAPEAGPAGQGEQELCVALQGSMQRVQSAGPRRLTWCGPLTAAGLAALSAAACTAGRLQSLALRNCNGRTPVSGLAQLLLSLGAPAQRSAGAEEAREQVPQPTAHPPLDLELDLQLESILAADVEALRLPLLALAPRLRSFTCSNQRLAVCLEQDAPPGGLTPDHRMLDGFGEEDGVWGDDDSVWEDSDLTPVDDAFPEPDPPDSEMLRMWAMGARGFTVCTRFIRRRPETSVLVDLLSHCTQLEVLRLQHKQLPLPALRALPRSLRHLKLQLLAPRAEGPCRAITDANWMAAWDTQCTALAQALHGLATLDLQVWMPPCWGSTPWPSLSPDHSLAQRSASRLLDSIAPCSQLRQLTLFLQPVPNADDDAGSYCFEEASEAGQVDALLQKLAATLKQLPLLHTLRLGSADGIQCTLFNPDGLAGMPRERYFALSDELRGSLGAMGGLRSLALSGGWPPELAFALLHPTHGSQAGACPLLHTLALHLNCSSPRIQAAGAPADGPRQLGGAAGDARIPWASSDAARYRAMAGTLAGYTHLQDLTLLCDAEALPRKKRKPAVQQGMGPAQRCMLALLSALPALPHLRRLKLGVEWDTASMAVLSVGLPACRKLLSLCIFGTPLDRKEHSQQSAFVDAAKAVLAGALRLPLLQELQLQRAFTHGAVMQALADAVRGEPVGSLPPRPDGHGAATASWAVGAAAVGALGSGPAAALPVATGSQPRAAAHGLSSSSAGCAAGAPSSGGQPDAAALPGQHLRHLTLWTGHTGLLRADALVDALVDAQHMASLKHVEVLHSPGVNVAKNVQGTWLEPSAQASLAQRWLAAHHLAASGARFSVDVAPGYSMRAWRDTKGCGGRGHAVKLPGGQWATDAASGCILHYRSEVSHGT